MATRNEWDELQNHNKENQDTKLNDTDANDDGEDNATAHFTDCVALHNWARARSPDPCTVHHTHIWLKLKLKRSLAPFTSITMPYTWVVVSLWLDLLRSLLLHFPPARLPFPLLPLLPRAATGALLKGHGKPAPLRGEESEDTYDVFNSPTGYVFQDMEPSKSSSILRKSSDIRKPTRCVKSTKAVALHADIRDQNPSLGMICPGEPHQRSPNAPNFEDRSQEETEWQEQGAHEAAWKLAKSVLKFKEQERATFLLPSENRCLAASTLEPAEREFVVDSGASMHMISKKDLNDAEMDTLTKSCSPTIIITANGEVQTHEEATVYFKELDIFFDNENPRKHASSIIARKALRWKRIFLWVDQRSKTTSHLKRDSHTVQYGELRSDRGSRLVNEFFIQFWFINFNDTFKTGE